MMSFKWPLILICLFTLVGCQPKGEEAADVGLSNISSSKLMGPVLTSQDVEVEHGSYALLDLTATNEDSTFIYSISKQPMYGTITDTAPIVIYTPSEGFLGYDRFYFSALNAKGQWSQGTVSIHVVPDTTTIYLRATGNDTTARVDSLSRPFLTAQKAVEAAIELSPSPTNPVVIDVGTGSFGNITLTDDLNAYISWSVSDLVTPVIGNITATGTTGDDDEDGGRGWDININADPSITFGNITSQGGNGGGATTRDTYGGRPGAITIKGVVGNIHSIPGTGEKKSGGPCLGQSAGTVVVEEDSEAGNIFAEGAACDDSGDGGNVIINGELTGSVYASGGSSGASGIGGNVWVKGSVLGSVYAAGGDGVTGGAGGFVSVNGIIAGGIEAIGGSGATARGGKGGTAEIQIGASLLDVNVSGGNGATVGGQGGDITVIDATARNMTANGGAGVTGGAGGAITLDSNAEVSILSAVGGTCTTTTGGDGGILYIHSSATYNSDDSVYGGGTCDSGGTAGSAGGLTSF